MPSFSKISTGNPVTPTRGTKRERTPSFDVDFFSPSTDQKLLNTSRKKFCLGIDLANFEDMPTLNFGVRCGQSTSEVSGDESPRNSPTSSPLGSDSSDMTGTQYHGYQSPSDAYADLFRAESSSSISSGTENNGYESPSDAFAQLHRTGATSSDATDTVDSPYMSSEDYQALYDFVRGVSADTSSSASPHDSGYCSQSSSEETQSHGHHSEDETLDVSDIDCDAFSSPSDANAELQRIVNRGGATPASETDAQQSGEESPTSQAFVELYRQNMANANDQNEPEAFPTIPGSLYSSPDFNEYPTPVRSSSPAYHPAPAAPAVIEYAVDWWINEPAFIAQEIHSHTQHLRLTAFGDPFYRRGVRVYTSNHMTPWSYDIHYMTATPGYMRFAPVRW